MPMKHFFWGSFILNKQKKQKQSSLGVLGYIWNICKGAPKILSLDQICLLSMQVKAREVGDWATYAGKGFLPKKHPNKPHRGRKCFFNKDSSLFLPMGKILKRNCFSCFWSCHVNNSVKWHLLVLSPGVEKCCVAVVFWHQQFMIFNTNLQRWCQQQCCQYQSAVVSFVCLAPFFWRQKHEGASSTKFLTLLPCQRKWTTVKRPYC